MTEKDEAAKNWEMVLERNKLVEKLTRLENELKKFVASWGELGRDGSTLARRRFQFGDDSLKVLNPSNSNAVIATVPWAHLDGETVKRLLGDLQETREALEEAEKSLRALGVHFAL